MQEIELLNKYIRPLFSNPKDMDDDAAYLRLPLFKKMIVSCDSAIENVHFFPNASPSSVAHNAVVSSISDLISKGVKPKYYMMDLTLSNSVSEEWVAEFAHYIKQLNRYYKIKLVGGNLSVNTNGCTSVSVSAFGWRSCFASLPKRWKVKRGHDLYIVGYIGDAPFGQKIVEGGVHLDDKGLSSYFVSRFKFLDVKLTTVPLIRKFACASMDVSDGIIADATKMAMASNKNFVINVDALPISPQVDSLNLSPEDKIKLFSVGGDYATLFSAKNSKYFKIKKYAFKHGLIVSRIGFVEGSHRYKYGDNRFVRLVDSSGKEYNIYNTINAGYQHSITTERRRKRN